ncbi:MAG TPA: chemotaxis protein CheW [Tissierellaceae bacterium]
MNQYIVFKSNNEKVALNISHIERIIEYEDPSKIPESSKYLLGVIQYNKTVIPVIDLTYKLYQIKKDIYANEKIIIINWNDTLIGLLIDDILGIEQYEDDQYEENIIKTSIIKDYIKGFIKSEDKEDIIIVLNIEKIFNEKQSEEILTASKRN